MLKKVKEFFEDAEVSLEVDSSGEATNQDLHVATTVLLIEMASADKSIAKEEADAVCQSLQNQFGIPEDEVAELVKIAISVRKEAGKIDKFVEVINESFSENQRQQILAMIWKVVMADGMIDKFEDRFAQQMKNRFKLSDELAEQARTMAVKGEI